MAPLFGFDFLGPQQMIILLIIGVLFYGKRLPEIGRYLGKGIVEFKKGMKGFEDEIEGTSNVQRHEAPPALEPPRPPQRVVTTAPKFEDNASNITTPPQS
jgi:sec-independent protein translocase protein TatA